MFTNYSQTYTSAITSVAGLIVTVLAAFGIDLIGQQDIQFLAGLLVNLGGVVWTLIHRVKKGDVTPLGFRK